MDARAARSAAGPGAARSASWRSGVWALVVAGPVGRPHCWRWPTRCSPGSRWCWRAARRPAGASASARRPASPVQSALSGLLARGRSCAERWPGPTAPAGSWRGRRRWRRCWCWGSPAAAYATVLAYTELPAPGGPGRERAVSLGERLVGALGGAAGAAALPSRRARARGVGRLGAGGGSGALPGPAGDRVGGDQPPATAARHRVHRRLHRVLLRDRARPQPLPGGHLRGRLVEVHRLPGRRACARTQGVRYYIDCNRIPGRPFPRRLPVRRRRLRRPPGGLQPLPLRPVQHPGQRDHRGRLPAGHLPSTRRRSRAGTATRP